MLLWSPWCGGFRGGPIAGPAGPQTHCSPAPPGAFPGKREFCHLSAAGAASSPSRHRSVWERPPAKRQAINADSSSLGGFLIATSKTLHEKAAETGAFLAESAQAGRRAFSARTGRPGLPACSPPLVLISEDGKAGVPESRLYQSAPSQQKTAHKFLIENLSHVLKKCGDCQLLGKEDPAHTHTHAAGSQPAGWYFMKVPSRALGVRYVALQKLARLKAEVKYPSSENRNSSSASSQ